MPAFWASMAMKPASRLPCSENNGVQSCRRRRPCCSYHRPATTPLEMAQMPLKKEGSKAHVPQANCLTFVPYDSSFHFPFRPRLAVSALYHIHYGFLLPEFQPPSRLQRATLPYQGRLCMWKPYLFARLLQEACPGSLGETERLDERRTRPFGGSAQRAGQLSALSRSQPYSGMSLRLASSAFASGFAAGRQQQRALQRGSELPQASGMRIVLPGEEDDLLQALLGAHTAACISRSPRGPRRQRHGWRRLTSALTCHHGPVLAGGAELVATRLILVGAHNDRLARCWRRS